jgi:hypothetical protein
MAIVRCNVSVCAYRGKEVCTADRINIVDGECKTACTYSQLMRQRPNQSEKGKDNVD